MRNLILLLALVLVTSCSKDEGEALECKCLVVVSGGGTSGKLSIDVNETIEDVSCGTQEEREDFIMNELPNLISVGYTISLGTSEIIANVLDVDFIPQGCE